MNNKQKNVQTDRARLGAMGECNVISLLMQQGWDAFNANCIIKNYKSIDIVCVKMDTNLWKLKTAFVQVKTCRQKNIPIGFTNGECCDKDYLTKIVQGPYVLIYAEEADKTYKFRYFVLSRMQFIELAHQAHVYYMHGYKRENELSENGMGGLYVRWLEGKSDPATDKHIAFDNPLKGIASENKWENIWKD